MTTTRRRGALAVTVAALAGAAVGIGGSSLALWRDAAEVGGAVSTGYQYFAVGSPGSTVPAPSGTATVTVGREAATALLRDGEVAVPIQVDSLSQGNKGLRYELTTPDTWGQGLLAAGGATVFRVPTAAACDVDALSPGTLPAPGPTTSTPVPATYTTGTDPVTEFWCVYAAYDGPDERGEYENTATVTATAPDGREVTGEDDWHAVVVEDLDPAAEPDHTITITATTFRPGGQP